MKVIADYRLKVFKLLSKIDSRWLAYLGMSAILANLLSLILPLITALIMGVGFIIFPRFWYRVYRDVFHGENNKVDWIINGCILGGVLIGIGLTMLHNNNLKII